MNISKCVIHLVCLTCFENNHFSKNIFITTKENLMTIKLSLPNLSSIQKIIKLLFVCLL